MLKEFKNYQYITKRLLSRNVQTRNAALWREIQIIFHQYWLKLERNELQRKSEEVNMIKGKICDSGDQKRVKDTCWQRWRQNKMTMTSDEQTISGDYVNGK